MSSQITVLVTGGAGYIGSHTAKALARAGYRVVVYDNLSRGHRWAVRWGPLEEGELLDTEHLRKVMVAERVEAVLHFAALIEVGESMKTPETFFRNNVSGSLSLLNAMRDAGVRRIVFSSTCALYGFPEKVPIAEDTPTAPLSPYGESKLMVERLLHWEGVCHGLQWMALRYFNAAGADAEGESGESHSPETHLIPSLFEAALGRRPACSIFGGDYPTPDGTCIRDYIHVTDLANAHVRALRHLLDGKPSMVLNLGTGDGFSVNQILAAAERIIGKPIPVERKGRRAGDPPRLVAAPQKAFEQLDWKPAHSSIENIIETAWRWSSHAHSPKASLSV